MPKKDDDVCSICFSEYKVGEKVKKLSCIHYYHTSCITNWLTRKKECPVCKREVVI